MKTLIKHVLPQTGLFTLVLILITTAYQVIENGPLKALFLNLLALIAGAFVLSCLEFYFFNRKYFNSYRLLLFTSALTWYIGLGCLMFFSGWIFFSLSNLITFTIEFAIIYYGFILYHRYRLKKDAEEINSYLEKRNSKN